jgi:putative hydrolase of the HAD superfamily
MRIIGDFETVEANIEYVLNAMNEHARVEQIQRAVEIRMRYIAQALQPEPDAIDTLTQLKDQGYKIGLISNCSIEIPMLWQHTAFADIIHAPVFSGRVRLRKPDTRIYHLACDGLGVMPESCLYVADGEDHELAAAANVGLHPVLIRTSSRENLSEVHREAREWQGATIASLTEVLELVRD